MQRTGGVRTLNDALKVAWRDGLSNIEEERPNVKKVIVALTRGDIK